MARNAPEKHFHKGHSLVEVTRVFPDDAAAERWFTRIRETQAKADGPPFAGPVEAAEIYMGGKRKNMPKATGERPWRGTARSARWRWPGRRIGRRSA